MLRGAKLAGPVEWGKMAGRSQYALVMLATEFTWMMALMGYIRSSVRLFWHVNEIHARQQSVGLHPYGGIRGQHDLVQRAVLLGQHSLRVLVGVAG